jgi:hypothetical protein
MTGTLAVTAGRGKVGLGRAGLGPAAKAFIPARRAGRYPGFLFRRNIPAKEICRPSVQTVPGYYGGYYDEDGRDHTTLPGFGSPAARHERRRIGMATGMAWRAKATGDRR